MAENKLEYLDLEGEAALLQKRADGRAYAWVYDGKAWQKVAIAEIMLSARIISEDDFKKRFAKVGLPKELTQ